jgi:hypothetical protein
LAGCPDKIKVFKVEKFQSFKVNPNRTSPKIPASLPSVKSSAKTLKP